jgi:hypothetical protein
LYEFCGESIFFESRVTEKKDLSFLRETSHFDFMDLERWIFVLCLFLFCKGPAYISFFFWKKKRAVFCDFGKEEVEMKSFAVIFTKEKSRFFPFFRFYPHLTLQDGRVR